MRIWVAAPFVAAFLRDVSIESSYLHIPERFAEFLAEFGVLVFPKPHVLLSSQFQQLQRRVGSGCGWCA